MSRGPARVNPTASASTAATADSGRKGEERAPGPAMTRTCPPGPSNVPNHPDI